jgi:hypothetical protein
MELIVLLRELEARIRLQGRRILKQVLTPQSHVDLRVTGVYKSVNFFGPTRMFPRGPFLLNILSFDRGTIHARGVNSNLFFMDLRGVFYRQSGHPLLLCGSRSFV